MLFGRCVGSDQHRRGTQPGQQGSLKAGHAQVGDDVERLGPLGDRCVDGAGGLVKLGHQVKADGGHELVPGQTKLGNHPAEQGLVRGGVDIATKGQAGLQPGAERSHPRVVRRPAEHLVRGGEDGSSALRLARLGGDLGPEAHGIGLEDRAGVGSKKCNALGELGIGVVGVAAEIAEEASPHQGPAEGERSGRTGAGKGRLEPPIALANCARHPTVQRQVGRDAQRHLPVASVDRPVERNPDVVPVGLHGVVPGALIPPLERRPTPGAQPGIVAAEAVERLVQFLPLDQPLPPVLPQRLEHAVAGLAAAAVDGEQRLLHEGRQQIGDVIALQRVGAADGLGVIEHATPGKHG